MLPDQSNSGDDPSAAAAAHEKALVDALVISVHETLKMEDAAEADGAIPIGICKPACMEKVFSFSLLSYLTICLQVWEHPKLPLVVPKCFCGITSIEVDCPPRPPGGGPSCFQVQANMIPLEEFPWPLKIRLIEKQSLWSAACFLLLV